MRTHDNEIRLDFGGGPQNSVKGITVNDQRTDAYAPKLGHRFDLFAQQSLSLALL